MRDLSIDEMSLVSGGDDSTEVSEVVVTARRSDTGQSFSFLLQVPSDANGPPLQGDRPPPIDVGFDLSDAIKLYISKQFGGYLEIQERDKASHYDRDKIVKTGEFWYEADKMPITLKLKAEYEADGSFWLDLNDNTKGDTHVKAYPEGFRYDSDNDGHFDKLVTDATFLI
ncbi:MAG TPA: hypothetical protein VN113_06655 [Caulobacter sp.]|nr:hypothetical protein [Caulobacter sp.]